MAMELTHTALVAAPVARAWALLNDPEVVADCLPGAVLQERHGDLSRGTLTLKVGPVTASYDGTVTVVRRDEEAGRLELEAVGDERAGAGRVAATFDLTLTEDAGGTRVTAVTTLAISGRVGQFGTGVLDHLGARLMADLATELERRAAVPEPAGRRRRGRRGRRDKDEATPTAPVVDAVPAPWPPAAEPEPPVEWLLESVSVTAPTPEAPAPDDEPTAEPAEPPKRRRAKKAPPEPDPVLVWRPQPLPRATCPRRRRPRRWRPAPCRTSARWSCPRPRSWWVGRRRRSCRRSRPSQRGPSRRWSRRSPSLWWCPSQHQRRSRNPQCGRRRRFQTRHPSRRLSQ